MTAPVTYLIDSKVAQTTTWSSVTQVNTAHDGVKIILVTTAIGTGSITLSIEEYMEVPATWATLLTGAAVITNTTNTYSVFPGSAVSANVSANNFLAPKWRVTVTHNNANAATYSVSAVLKGG